jgi:hypothetical protein
VAAEIADVHCLQLVDALAGHGAGDLVESQQAKADKDSNRDGQIQRALVAELAPVEKVNKPAR